MGTSDEEEEKQPSSGTGNVIKDILQKFNIDKKFGKSD
jgi:hypothetical protein